MDFKIESGNKLNLDFYKNNRIKTYKNFDVLTILNNNNIIAFATHIKDGNLTKLFNLVINNLSDINSVIQYLIKNKFVDISFDFYHLTHMFSGKNLIEHLLNNNFNNPFIDSKSKIGIQALNLLYKPEQPNTSIEFIQYLLKEYAKGDTTPCKATGVFNKDLLDKLYLQIMNPESDEISGKLKIDEVVDFKNDIVFEIKLENFKNGGKIEADVVESRYNFHTHPISAYTQFNCDLGWPSLDDYWIFITSTIENKNQTVFHFVCTKEGIYVLSIPQNSINYLQSLKDRKDLKKIVGTDEKNGGLIRQYLLDNLEVEKANFKMKTGIEKNGVHITDVKSYLNFIKKANNFEIIHNDRLLSFPLVDVQFFDWFGPLGLRETDLNRIDFTYYYPKINGNCIVNEDHLPQFRNKKHRTRKRKNNN